MELQESESISTKYVAFCDILGFSASLERDFEATLSMYRSLTEKIDPVLERDSVELTVYSDAILVTGNALWPVAQSVQILSFIALQENMLIRGGISMGRYWERKEGRHLFVVSDALVRSVRLEASVSVPAVVLGSEIEITNEAWMMRFANSQFATPILHFQGMSIVNPFSLMWGYSAGTRARLLMEKSDPRHRSKYEWFLSLHEAVMNGEPLIPDSALQWGIDKGILRFTPYEDTAADG